MNVGDVPRLLFVTPAAFNRITGGGLTFSNLFAGWPKDRLATVHCDPVPTSDDVCDHYYRLGPREIRAVGPLQRFRGDAPIAAGANGANGTSACDGFVRPGLKNVKRFLFGDSLPEVGRLSPALESWIDRFQPQAMYTILGSNGLIELVDAIHERFHLPYAVHFMDDWLSAHHRRGLLGWIERGRMNRLVDGAVAKAARRLAISDSMAEAYGRRWGVSFGAYQNAVDARSWASFAKRDLTVSKPARLVYTGSILPFAQLDSLAVCCEAVARLNAAGVPVVLDIHAPDFFSEPARARLQIAPSIRLLAPITDDETYYRTLAAADALLLPVNFDPDSVRFIRYSYPTKVSPYLLSGTPILVFGPAGVEQVEYARRHGWGHVVDTPGPEAALGGLRRILEDAPLRAAISQAAHRLAIERHDSALVRDRFRAELIATAAPAHA